MSHIWVARVRRLNYADQFKERGRYEYRTICVEAPCLADAVPLAKEYGWEVITVERDRRVWPRT